MSVPDNDNDQQNYDSGSGENPGDSSSRREPEHQPSPGKETRTREPQFEDDDSSSDSSSTPDPMFDEEEYGDEEYERELHEDEEGGRGEMGFFEHLEELRWRIIKALISLVVAAGICAIFIDELIENILLGPATRANITLQNLEMMGQITLAIQVCLISGLILSIPFIIWQFWQFIKPGLYRKERKYVSVIAAATIICFLAGISFAYFVMLPTSIGFAQTFEFGSITNAFSVGSYFSFVLGFMLACGAIFEMPMLSYALSRFGILTPAFMRQYRRHALVIILIAAAIITPTPDPFNQLLLAVPLYLLYELSIMVSRFAKGQRNEFIEEMESEAEGTA